MLLDWRYRLALFWQWRTTLRLVLISFGFLLVWDVALITADVYWTKPEYVSGWFVLTPNLPIEELGFLLFLSYITVLAWRWKWPRTSS